jgi:phosphonatase-like hydrolase
MDPPLPALAVFDLAGTTLEDDGTVAALFKEVLAAEGLTLGPEQLARVRGAAKREAFRTLAGGAARAERMFESFLRAIRQHYAARAPREVAGASATLAWLSQRGVQLALNTGFDRSTAEPLVAAMGWATRFDALVCGDDVAAGRPDPAMILEAMRRTGVSEPGRVMVVGDTVLDLQAGTAAGAAWVVGVLSGAHDRARMSLTPHTHLLASVAHVPGLLGGGSQPCTADGQEPGQGPTD